MKNKPKWDIYTFHRRRGKGGTLEEKTKVLLGEFRGKEDQNNSQTLFIPFFIIQWKTSQNLTCGGTDSQFMMQIFRILLVSVTMSSQCCAPAMPPCSHTGSPLSPLTLNPNLAHHPHLERFCWLLATPQLPHGAQTRPGPQIIRWYLAAKTLNFSAHSTPKCGNSLDI